MEKFFFAVFARSEYKIAHKNFPLKTEKRASERSEEHRKKAHTTTTKKRWQKRVENKVENKIK